MRSVFFSFMLLSLVACGDGGNSSDRKQVMQPTACPPSLAPTYHQITITSKIAIPAKLAIVLDGVRKFDECLENPVILPPPIVSVQRNADNKIVITARHFGAYQTLPTNFSLDIIELENCETDGAIFFFVENVPLEFSTVYPNGKECGGNISAKVELINE